uniref:Succinate dehydrogenase [ubiquinone] cytochrome b small subunit n=1 Tax=Heliothis virescens TaxID=7102 RepID=A0A2A4JSV9_HELVI
MALSTLLRTPAMRSALFSQQIKKLATQSNMKRPVVSMLPATTMALKEINSTPIINSVRSFRTSPVRMSDEKPHDHSKLWVIEKAVAALMIPLLPMGLLLPNRILDSVIAILICAHSFWGLEAIAIDYVRASVVGPILPKIALGLVYLISIATLGGLFYIISHDVGIANMIKQIWAIKSDRQK